MATYVLPIEDTFLEETQHLVLKMLGLMMPPDFEFEDDVQVNTFDVSVEKHHQQVTSVEETIIIHTRSHSQNHQQEVLLVDLVDRLTVSDDDLETAEGPECFNEEVTYSNERRIVLAERNIELVALKLEEIGKQVMMTYMKHFEDLEPALLNTGSYSSFKLLMNNLIPSPIPMWYKISMLFGVSRHLVSAKKKQSQLVDSITSFTIEYIQENFADYIIENGGWESIASASVEKCALECFHVNKEYDDQTITDERSKEDEKSKQGDEDDCTGNNEEIAIISVSESSLLEYGLFIVTAMAAVVAVAYSVMKT